MATLEIKDGKGKVVGKHDVSKNVADAAPIMAVLHRAVVAEQANSRQGTQSAKTRSETRGGGRKPYKQKKTGNARQGTIRAPHYAHGGMAFAVKPRDYSKKINKKERRGAILGAIAAQMTAGNVTLVDKVVFSSPKTKDATALLTALGFNETRRVLIILPVYDETTYKCFKNLPNVVVRTAPVSSAKADGAEAEAPVKSKKKVVVASTHDKTAAFSTRDILVAHKIIITQDAMTKIEEVWA